MSAPLNPHQFGVYYPPAVAQRDNTYPVWGETHDTEVVHGRPAATHKARERVLAAKKVTHVTWPKSKSN